MNKQQQSGRAAGRMLRVLLSAVITLGVGLGGASHAAATPAAAATTVASDLMGPHWQGRSHGTPATGHEFDCYYTNAQWSNHACTVSIYTITSGANCYFEAIATPASGAGGENYYSNTQCQIHLDGVATWKTDSTGACAYTVGLDATWASGVNSTLFNGTSYKTKAVMTHAASGTYHLGVTANVGDLPQHKLNMVDHFVVEFPTASCPNTVQTGIRGNVYDPVADLTGAASSGYFQDSVAG